VGAHITARSAAVGRRHVVGGQEGSAPRVKRGRVGVSVVLAVEVRRPGGGPRVDGKGGAVVGDAVVAQHGCRGERRRDVVGAYITARSPAVGRRHVVGGQEGSAPCGQRARVGGAVGLAVGVRRPVGGLRVAGI